jgi:hypothetical protein
VSTGTPPCGCKLELILGAIAPLHTKVTINKQHTQTVYTKKVLTLLVKKKIILVLVSRNLGKERKEKPLTIKFKVFKPP